MGLTVAAMGLIGLGGLFYAFSENEHVAEIRVHAPRNDLTAKASHEDVHAAVDSALDKIEQQMRRLKDKFKVSARVICDLRTFNHNNHS